MGLSGLLNGIRREMEERVEVAENGIAAATRHKASHEAEAAELEAQLTAKHTETQEKKISLAKDALAFRASKLALSEATQQQKLGDAELEVAESSKKDLEDILSGTLRQLKTGAAFDD